ncbi:MAG TPA: hypothetical protein VGS12_10850 [Caulobacteraceae bacterium]|nr:hypothetical protein [Caulobacteraceae bacterium]
MDMADQENIAWDLGSYFSAPEGEELRAFLMALEADAGAFAATAQAAAPALEDWPQLLASEESLEARLRHLSSYLYCVRSAEPGNAAAEAAYTAEIRLRGGFDAAAAVLGSALGRLDDDAFERLLAAPALSGLAWRLRRRRQDAAHTLSPAEERLAADLMEDSLHGWSRLADAIFASLTFDAGGGTARFAERYDYLWDADAGVRRRAYAGLKAALAGVERTLAACLNGMTGARRTLLERRRLDPVGEAAERMSVAPATIETMMQAVFDGRGRLQRYLALKARALGLAELEMPDRWAPLGDSARLSPPECLDEVATAFARLCPPMADAVGRIRARRWIDYRMGAEKTGGGFCVDSPLHGEPRVHVNTEGMFLGRTVLAHELGHAFHFISLAGLRPWLRLPPSTLAETASITAEHVFRAGVLAQPGLPAPRRLEVLGSELDAAVNYCLRIPRDFEFERDLFPARGEGELTAERLEALARQAHTRWFEGSWAPDGDEYSWTSPLMFSTYTNFFNFPYTFGYLLGRAIAQSIERDGAPAIERYVDFLKKTGAMGAEEAAASALGFDIAGAQFWRQALASLDPRIDAFEKATG